MNNQAYKTNSHKYSIMNFIYLILFCVISMPIHGQDHIEPYKLNSNGILYYEELVEDSMMSKNDFFIQSKSWIANVFHDAKEVEMFSDKEEGLIIGKGTIRLKRDVFSAIGGSQDYLRFTIKIFCKDEKAKIVIDNIGFQTIGNEYIDGKKIVPIEFQYWKNGDTSKKIRTGFKKDKDIKSSAVIAITESWAISLKNSDSDYSDF